MDLNTAETEELSAKKFEDDMDAHEFFEKFD